MVQQVRRPVRLGVLAPGDRLPTVKEVVAGLAINPNTVLRAYRELELEHGTHRLDWTQSITRGRWLAGKLGLAVATTLVAALALTRSSPGGARRSSISRAG